MLLSDGPKSFQIGLAISIQYRHDTQPATQRRCCSKDTAYYVARVKANQPLNIHRVRILNTTVWRRAGKNLGFYISKVLVLERKRQNSDF